MPRMRTSSELLRSPQGELLIFHPGSEQKTHKTGRFSSRFCIRLTEAVLRGIMILSRVGYTKERKTDYELLDSKHKKYLRSGTPRLV